MDRSGDHPFDLPRIAASSVGNLAPVTLEAFVDEVPDAGASPDASAPVDAGPGPAGDQDEQVPGPPPRPRTARHRPRVVVVSAREDEMEAVCGLLGPSNGDDDERPASGVVDLAPFAVTTVRSLALGLDAVGAMTPDAVLVGVGLPDADLLDAVQALRGAAPRATLAVLAGFADEGRALDALKLGADEVLQREALDHGALGTLVRVAAERRRLDERRAFLAGHDLLTGLENRSSFLRRLRRAMPRDGRRRELTGVVVCNLDGLGKINAGHGVEAGDAVLREMAARLRAAVRGDDGVARLGGAAFAIALEGLPRREDAAGIVERAREAATAPLPGLAARLGLTVGVAFAPRDADEAEALLAHAEAAARRAREQDPRGGAVVPASPGIDDLRAAWREGRLRVAYQPQVDVGAATPRVVGHEALLRLVEPGGQVHAAETFLPALAGSDLMLSVGRWVLETAARRLSRRGKAGPGDGDRLAVNLSPRELGDPGFRRDLHLLRVRFGLPEDVLELEVSEATLRRDPGWARGVLGELSSAGYRIVVDGFGVAGASLAELAALPIRRLELSRTLVRRLDHDPARAAVVAAALGLAEALRVELLAEGVERPEELRVLRGLGVRLAQGWLFGGPVG